MWAWASRPGRDEMPTSRRPDILIVMADQMAPSALPFHGNPVTRAPAMSWLAESGVVFDAAYTASPLCAPGRASFMTGLLPSRTRTYDNAAEFTSEIPTFAHYLRSAGYRTVLSGKMHFCGPDQLHGFEERLTTDIYPADYGWTPDWDCPHQRPSWYHDMSSVIQAGPCVRSNQLDFDDEVAFAAERSLFGHIRSGDERPFCYVVSFSHPHDPFTIPRKWWDLYHDVDIPMPDVGYDEASLHPHERRLREVCAMNGVEITGDQVRAAGRVPAAVSTMDLLPTLAGLAHDGDMSGIVGPLDGRSLLPHLSGAPGHDEVVAEYLAEGAIAPIVMIRRGRHKFIHSPADPDQLFDVAADPNERANLVDDLASAGRVEEFRREIAARWDLETLDREVRQSQQRRLAVSKALGSGVQTPWDFTPAYDASRRYIRNHMDLADLEEMARFPPVGRGTPR